ncbi:MAG: 50S ribosomal protein L13 [Candidatus Portnoybacteria bacterium CG10_big_fil_rev_8_21_14_0_10_44_7]|uniref:Large ribosomal subunit protein uL13 n=1 Tax=Candidatus Portnoybacteria bacterium CG10_big_fil_rev_8_21_14_0_10_44_7 TaxID=1974816 RepID=A0A2M8KJA3_9BACT|nr:MAG: 50S ribosomal protein L13 [Candidatus Portnoybacteria bacterium CG10_big_fil_rev_8_21_14_0_10_44_7]
MAKEKIHQIDARGKVLGRLAVEIADLLRGKKNPEFVPYHDRGERVVVSNTDHLLFTGKKRQQKEYKWHSGYPGGLKSKTLSRQMAEDSREVLRRAVFGMLPKNKLQAVFIKKLKLYKKEAQAK